MRPEPPWSSGSEPWISELSIKLLAKVIRAVMPETDFALSAWWIAWASGSRLGTGPLEVAATATAAHAAIAAATPPIDAHNRPVEAVRRNLIALAPSVAHPVQRPVKVT
jgi:hypothetical protein